MIRRQSETINDKLFEENVEKENVINDEVDNSSTPADIPVDDPFYNNKKEEPEPPKQEEPPKEEPEPPKEEPEPPKEEPEPPKEEPEPPKEEELSKEDEEKEIISVDKNDDMKQLIYSLKMYQKC